MYTRSICSCVECTSAVIQALALCRMHYPDHRREEIDNCIHKACNFIESLQRSDGSWLVLKLHYRRDYMHIVMNPPTPDRTLPPIWGGAPHSTRVPSASALRPLSPDLIPTRHRRHHRESPCDVAVAVAARAICGNDVGDVRDQGASVV
jgi:hypothetical protein